MSIHDHVIFGWWESAAPHQFKDHQIPLQRSHLLITDWLTAIYTSIWRKSRLKQNKTKQNDFTDPYWTHRSQTKKCICAWKYCIVLVYKIAFVQFSCSLLSVITFVSAFNKNHTAFGSPQIIAFFCNTYT